MWTFNNLTVVLVNQLYITLNWKCILRLCLPLVPPSVSYHQFLCMYFIYHLYLHKILQSLEKAHLLNNRNKLNLLYSVSAVDGLYLVIWPTFLISSFSGMFLTVRGIDELGEDFALPTCPGFLNVFHPVSLVITWPDISTITSRRMIFGFVFLHPARLIRFFFDT